MSDRSMEAGVGTPPIFIVGCIRSGTTLLAELVNAHPDLAIFCESFLFRSSFVMRHKWPKLRLADESRADAFVSFLLEEYNPYGHGQRPILAFLDAPDLRTVLLQSDRSPRAWLTGTFTAWAKSQGACRWGDKSTPHHAGEILEMHRLFPEARFVHIHRDPRGVAHSIVAAGWAPNVTTGAIIWRVAMNAIRSGLAAIPPDQVHEVSYASLCTSPEPVLRDLCSFLGERFSPRMLEHPRPANPTLANISLVPVTANTSAPILKENFNTWRSSLTTSEARAVESVTGTLMLRYGYPLGEGSPGPRVIDRIRTVRRMRGQRRSIHNRHRSLVDHLMQPFHRP